MEPSPSEFHAPLLDAPLDVEAAIDAIPSSATITGVFLTGIVIAATERGLRLPSAKESYLDFRQYPLREHARLLVDAARAYFPGDSLRLGLLRLGRGGPRTLLRSMVGRVVLGSVEGPLDALSAMAKSYALHTKPALVTVESLAPGRALVKMRNVYYFLDPHHVGVFEGVLRLAEVEGSVRIRSLGRFDADLLCEWRGALSPSSKPPRADKR
jgi:uncharacterized protein (TIGR02265 family)